VTPKQRAEHYAREFPRYPPLRYDERWLDGFWVLGQDYKGSGLYGAYPPAYLKRLRAIFPQEIAGRVLHLFSGSLDAHAVIPGIRVEISLARIPAPDVYADATVLPFQDATFDLILADPPYTSIDAQKYGTKMINRAAVFRECARVVKPGGHLIWLDQRHPMHRKREWLWWGIIGLARSTNHVYRAVTFFQRRADGMKSLSARIKEASPTLAAALAILLGEDVSAVGAATSENKKKAVDDDEDEDTPTPKRRGRPAGSRNKKEDDEDEDAPVLTKKKLKAPVDDEDEDVDEEEAEDADEQAGTIPSDKTLADMDRATLKALAIKQGIDAAGKGREDLTTLLQAARDGKKTKATTKVKAAADDEEEDDEPAPAKKKKAVVKEDEDNKEPSLKEMKRDLEAFFKVNKDFLKAQGFFGGKPRKGNAPAAHTYDEVMADPDLIKEDWTDNLLELGEDGRKKLRAEAAEIEDEDDDE
jgi:SAM-dependent methyltransferase